MVGLVLCLAVSRRCKEGGRSSLCNSCAEFLKLKSIKNQDVHVLTVGHMLVPKAYFDPLLERIGGKTGAEANLCGEIFGCT